LEKEIHPAGLSDPVIARSEATKQSRGRVSARGLPRLALAMTAGTLETPPRFSP
jgi:hypothetical protein